MRSTTQHSGRRPGWRQLKRNIVDERERLASYLALETADILAGAIPANLLTLDKRPQATESELFRLWRFHGRSLLKSAGLSVRKLSEQPELVHLLIYSREQLKATLAQAEVADLLRRSGYHVTADPETVLDGLQIRFAERREPPEIGVLLGYPVKDVAGYMGLTSLPFSGRGLWSFYGAPGPSLRLVEAIRRSRTQMAGRLIAGHSPLACLTGKDREARDFFSANPDNDFHSHGRSEPCVSR